MAMINQVCAVMVTYNGGEKIEESISALIHQIDQLIIVDNGSNVQTVTLLKAIKETYKEKVIFRFNETNVGLATALNQGVLAARNDDYPFILLMDQDSYAASDMVEKMLNAFQTSEQHTIGVIGPTTQLLHQEGTLQPLSDDKKLLDVDVVWTSGSLIPSEVFKKLGSFRDDFFIDHIDHEFCFRLRKAGLRVTKCTNASMKHQLGNLRIGKFLGVSTGFYNYSPVRHYYMARNGLILCLELKMLSFLKFYLNWEIKSFIKVLLFETNKAKKIQMMLRGVNHAIKGTMGKIPFEY